MTWIYLALGLTASASFIAGNYILNRTGMLLVQVLGMTAVSIQYGLLGVWSVVAVNMVLLVRNLILWRRPWTPTAVARWGWVTLALLAITMMATNSIPTTLIAALPAIAAILNVAALATTRLPLLKAGLGAASLTWLLFDASYGNWQNMIGDAFGVAAALVALIRIWQLRAHGRRTTPLI